MSAKKGHIQKCRIKCCLRRISPCQGDVNLYVPKNEVPDDHPLHICNYHATFPCSLGSWTAIEHGPQNKDCKFE